MLHLVEGRGVVFVGVPAAEKSLRLGTSSFFCFRGWVDSLFGRGSI